MTWPNTSRDRFYFVLSVPEDTRERASARADAAPQYIIYIYFVAQIKPRYLLIADLAIALVDAGDERRKNNPAGSLLLSNYLGEIIAGFSEKLYIQSRRRISATTIRFAFSRCRDPR